MVILVKIFNGQGPVFPRTPLLPFSNSVLRAVQFKCLCGAPRAVPNNSDLMALGYSPQAGILSERGKTLKDHQTSPVSWDEIILK